MDGSPAYQMDPNQGNYAMINDSNFCGTSPMTYSQQVIVLSNAVLTPPPPGELISYSQKPDGCHTVIVRGLPVKITEDIIKEGFERYGEILDIRMNRRFCRIKFKNMNSVEQALLLSHYQIKIQNKEGGAYNGKLHVDYAIDQHDFQYRKQRMKREEKHCTFTSSPVHPFSDHEAASVKGKLGSAETKSRRKSIKDLKKEVTSFSSALIIERVEKDIDLNPEGNNTEEFCSKENPGNSKLHNLKEELDATNRKLKLTEKKLEDLEKTSSDEILKLKQAIEECKKNHVSENYEVIADNTCDSEKFKEKASVIDSYTQYESSSVYLAEDEICLIVLIAFYICVNHSMGSSISEISFFISDIYRHMITRELEILLKRFPNLFREDPTTKRWRIHQ